MSARGAMTREEAAPAKLSYRINEAAAAIGISRSKLYELIRAGELHTFDLFGRKLIRRDELQALVDRCSQTGKAA